MEEKQYLNFKSITFTLLLCQWGEHLKAFDRHVFTEYWSTRGSFNLCTSLPCQLFSSSSRPPVSYLSLTVKDFLVPYSLLMSFPPCLSLDWVNFAFIWAACFLGASFLELLRGLSTIYSSSFKLRTRLVFYILGESSVNVGIIVGKQHNFFHGDYSLMWQSSHHRRLVILSSSHDGGNFLSSYFY